MISKNHTDSDLSTLPVDVHCHGVGRFDFTALPFDALQTIEDILKTKKQRSILTLYLPQKQFSNFLTFMKRFARDKAKGLYRHIIGLALEGPLLASLGGTPKQGIWKPTKKEWQQIASCGEYGLIYCIFSPDADPGSLNDDSFPSDVEWITQNLIEGGVLPAAGHFMKDDPLKASATLQLIYNIVAKAGCVTITDHLYNDMPHNFMHAWRTATERSQRDSNINTLNIESWSLENMDEKLGYVPATMIRNARNGIVKIAMNFDGEHVDLAIVKKTIELVGAENIIMMTDSIESKILAGRHLTQKPGSSLLYQDEDIVAAGSTGVQQQIENLRSIHVSESDIELITFKNVMGVLQQRLEYIHDEIHALCI